MGSNEIKWLALNIQLYSFFNSSLELNEPDTSTLHILLQESMVRFTELMQA